MNKWLTTLFIMAGLFILASILSITFIDNSSITGDAIAVIPIEGVITGTSNSDIFGTSGTISTDIIETIKEVKENKNIKAVIIEINSPGGAAVASQEIADTIKTINKTKYGVIRDVGASGGYWVATATDRIYSSPISITGSIGVVSSYLEFSELFDKYGITYEKITGGEKKDLGSPYRELTSEERNLLQKKINLIHEFFIKEVAKNRNLGEEKVKELATGEFYTGEEAKELGLIDDYGSVEQVFEILKKEKNIPNAKLVYIKTEKGMIEILFGTAMYNVGRGIGAEIFTIQKENKLKIEV